MDLIEKMGRRLDLRRGCVAPLVAGELLGVDAGSNTYVATSLPGGSSCPSRRWFRLRSVVRGNRRRFRDALTTRREAGVVTSVR